MLAVRNFGHFWSRASVDWGKPGARGNLLGYTMWNYKPWVVDFRDQIAVYVLFTANREAVYVGQSGGRQNQRLFQRLKLHTRGALRGRWQFFSWFGLRAANENKKLSDYQKPTSRCGGTNADALNEIEAVLLQILEPRLNKQGPRWGDTTSEWLQYVPEEWEEPNPSVELQRMDDLSLQIDKLRTFIRDKLV